MSTYRDVIRKILYFEELGKLNLDQEITDASLNDLKEGMIHLVSNDVPYNDDRQMNIDDYLDKKGI
jgi:type IV secretory pathway ATPase VirB11/archaellum biosynthesis ATPase